ncbi:MAG: cobalamin B12-binding domain-containing protein, partial [Deltaproteobacteria bacterium]|nr:cobalamin B12-binding domain-containing protein [Deltaproteobacteria bacterium]
MANRQILLTSTRSPHLWQGPTALPFRIRRRAFGLYLIAENVTAPSLVLDRPTREAFARQLERDRFDLVGLSFTAASLASARDLARMVRLLQPQAHLMLGGPGAQLQGVERLVECDEVVVGDGIAATRRWLGEDEQAPVHLPALGAGIRMGATRRTELALLVPTVR